mmetsp:Transcript_25777/g.42926  ORF Transcript_25777/g.42926 Transcript_25777/m.42926 type:complete len:309 (-) Transcript_25777:175-1101(-)
MTTINATLAHIPPPIPNLSDVAAELRADRVTDGRCPHCATQLYETVRKGILRKKKTQPLSIAGHVVRGQCVRCLNGDDDAAAVALAAIAEPTAGDSLPAAMATPILSSPVMQLDTQYIGNFNNYGERHGEGELVWSNEDRYKGTFWNGVREGEGTLNFADGSEYVGNWKDNKMHGQGTRRFPNGNVYTGNYREGKRSGNGRCYYANGDMYVGEWGNDQMSGFGRYYYNNGQCFEGFFWEGKRSGMGKYQLTDGRVDIYRYESDSRIGEGVRWSANRKKAWRLVDGKVKGRVNLQVATDIAQRCEQGTS